MPSHKLVVRGTTTLSLHERFTRLSRMPRPAPPPAPLIPARAPPAIHPHHSVPQPALASRFYDPPPSHHPPRFHSADTGPDPPYHRPLRRSAPPPLWNAWDRAGAFRAALQIKRRSLIQHRLGVRRSAPRSAWGRPFRREHGRTTLRRRYGGAFLGHRGGGGRGWARRTRGAGARGVSGPPTVSKEELDSQLERYMSQTRTALDQDLDAYRQSGETR